MSKKKWRMQSSNERAWRQKATHLARDWVHVTGLCFGNPIRSVEETLHLNVAPKPKVLLEEGSR